MDYRFGTGKSTVRVSSFSNEDPLRNFSVRIRSELYDIPMIRMDDFSILGKSATVSELEMKRIDETLKRIKEYKDKYRV